MINPPDLRDCDILVSFRDAEWDGWMCREWKSGVKLVNAGVAGRPIISQGSAAMTEIVTHGCVISLPYHLRDAFDHCQMQTRRQAAFVAAEDSAFAYTVNAISRNYREILKSIARAEAA